jgi:tetratricopeptide (TPR) repeat protein
MDARARSPWLVSLVALVLVCSWPPVCLAEETVAPQAPESEQVQTGDDAAARRDEKQRAKEERIAEYLRRKEEQRLQREQRQREASVETAAAQGSNVPESAAQSAAPVAPAATGVAAAATAPPPRARSGRSALPRELAKAQASVRATALAEDPTVQEYLDKIDRQEAGAQQLAAFGSFLAQNGLVREALEYYEVALRLEPADAVLWVNYGTLHRQANDTSKAIDAYTKALSINSNNALAHYNLGAVHESMGRYDTAIHEFKTALSLDPTLGDPAYNPQVADNELMLAVKLMLYDEQVGSLGLPLLDVRTGQLPDAAKE